MTTTKWIAIDALPGRERPDPAEPPSSRIEPGTVLAELERLGQWVHVATPEGKHLWVDGRRLQPATPVEEPAGEVVAPTEPTPEPTPPPVQPVAPVWTVTHTVPPEGLQAWTQPDPSGPVIANLAGRVELRVVERRADWAHVDAENGWQGWLDGRRLVPVPGDAVQPPWSPVATTSDQPVTDASSGDKATATPISLRAIAAAAVLITVFLPWLGSWFSYGSSLDASDVPATFLWSPWTDVVDFPNMGTLMFVVGAAVLVTEFMARFKPYRRIAAWVTVGVAALYLVQTFRIFLDSEGDFASAISTMVSDGFAIGPWLALAAGIVLLVKRPSEA